MLSLKEFIREVNTVNTCLFIITKMQDMMMMMVIIIIIIGRTHFHFLAKIFQVFDPDSIRGMSVGYLWWKVAC